MPKAYAELAQRAPKYRVVCDYIAGMTDHFLLRQHTELLGNQARLDPRHSEARPLGLVIEDLVVGCVTLCHA